MNNRIAEITKGLNSEQEKGVTSMNGPVMIVAGAGSGKTRVLTHRIAYLLEHDVSPDKILALTFTNKAAKEMKERISSLVAPHLAERVWAGTFHSIFARILRQTASKIGYTSDFTIYDTDDSMGAVKRVMQNLGISNQQISHQVARNAISSAKNKMVTRKEYAQMATSIQEKQLALIYNEYENYLQLNNSMDFDDLLINLIVLLRQDREVLERYQNRFKYILVDEYQDTNRPQYIAIKLLAEAHQNICVVGDDAQSIYRWRGADIQNILHFKKDYPYSKIIRLEQNYRSTKTILEAADCIIKRNKNQIHKTLWTDNPEGEKIDLLRCNDDFDEAIKIATRVDMFSRNGYSLNDMTVLYRTNAQSMVLENALRKSNIPYIIVGGISFYKRKEIKDVLAYIRLLVNPKDDEAYYRIINEPPRGIGQTTLKHVRQYSSSKQMCLSDAFSRITEIDDLQQRAIIAIRDFEAFLNVYREKITIEENPANVIAEFIEKSGLLEMYKEMNTEESLDRWNNVWQILSDIKSFFKTNPELTIADYIQQISLMSDIDEKDLKSGSLTLMTVHSAKGLEYPIVFISGMERGLFPLQRQDMHEEEEEEERRLFYVAVTRAKERLILTYADRRARYGDVSEQSPSNFLREINQDLINRPEYRKPAATSFTAPKPKLFAKKEDNSFGNFSQIPEQDYYSQIEPVNVSFKVGDIIKHPHFGKGKIMQLSGVGKQLKAVIKFDSIGNKNLMLEYAKLEKI
ncbi:MAG: UvrD-helicase domain-containing protein [Candidatus Kapabacteria bacterium]|nr:UvrD-helicase domain-containing protein [Candidatus Kapabacteria bacterium]